MRIHTLRTEYLRNPEAVDVSCPRLSWMLEAGKNERGARQRAYRIQAASSEKRLLAGQADLWDSGFRWTSETSQIPYGGRALAPGQDCFWRVQVRGVDGAPSDFSETAHFRQGKPDFDASFLVYDRPLADGELTKPTAFGCAFEVREKMTRATLYITALGVMQVHLNGREYPDLILAPEWTQFHNRVQYRALNVTDFLTEGQNDLVATVSNGWYSGIWQFWPPKPYPYGTHPEICARLEIEYADGTVQTVVSDDTWHASETLPTTFAGIYEGETIDARIPMPRAKDLTLPVSVRKHPDMHVCAQKNEPIAISRVIGAKSVTEVQPGLFVVDFGENIAGRIRMRVHGSAGQQVEIFHNEMLNPDGTVYADNLIVAHYLEKADRQIVRYTCRGDVDGELISPRFTYMGFRYVEIRGLTEAPALEDMAVEVFGSDVHESGSFHCSNEEINRLQENILRSTRANLMGVPTDCPQRDERCGYTGDMQFFLPTALHNFDMAAFLSKWLVDLCQDSQLEDGSYTDHAPRFGVWSGNVAWGDAGILCPYQAYREYGDRENLRQHFDSMERYMDYLCRTANADFTRGPDFCGNGDWLHSGGGASAEIIATTYFAYTAGLMEKMARAIGREDRAGYYHSLNAKIKAALWAQYLRPDGVLIGGGVTGYTLLFTMDLMPDDPALYARTADAFAAAVEAADCRITTGFIGTPRLLIALHKIGRDDLAERLLMQRECPSWLYPVSVGATTIWERYNGWTEKDGFADSNMNSFNHFAFGSVGDYFYDGILGIQLPEYDEPHIVRVNPVYLSSLSHAEGKRCVYDSEIAVAWERNDAGKICLRVNVGANLRATVTFGGKETLCECGSYIFKEA